MKQIRAKNIDTWLHMRYTRCVGPPRVGSSRSIRAQKPSESEKTWMAIYKYGPDAFFITAAGLSENPQHHMPEEIGQMSYEFALFLKKWELGDVGRTPFHVRNFKIATRKGCYPKPLLTQLGIFTEEGHKVLARAKSLLDQMVAHYASVGLPASALPAWDDTQTMDSIILAGQIETKHLVFLKTLHNHLFPVNYSNLTHMSMEMPLDLQFNFTEYNGIPYMLCAPLRDYPQRRKDFERLVKFGLVELASLPKPVERHGRGRAPVGATFTITGLRFFENFLDLNDPQRIASRKRKQEQLGYE